jgi:hypothetical protein
MWWPFGRRKKQRKAREVAAAAHFCENPLPAHSVREEYLYLATRLCKCGGRLSAFDHALRYYKGQPRDVIQAGCSRCRGFYCFVYDISFFFGKEDDEIDTHAPSRILDVMDWAHHGYTCLHQSAHASGERQDELLEDAIWAFEEMLKFYPTNGSYPFPHAFFNHQAVEYSNLRNRYPRHLPIDALNAAKARLSEP